MVSSQVTQSGLAWKVGICSKLLKTGVWLAKGKWILVDGVGLGVSVVVDDIGTSQAMEDGSAV